MGNAFASVETVRIDLPCGKWIEVKQELSWGEEQRLISGGIGRVSVDDPEATIDLAEFHIRRVLTWVAEWSVTDKDGKTVPVNRKSVETLKASLGREIHQALDRHIAAAEGNPSSPEAQPGPEVSQPESSSSASSAGAARSHSARKPKSG